MAQRSSAQRPRRCRYGVHTISAPWPVHHAGRNQQALTRSEPFYVAHDSAHGCHGALVSSSTVYQHDWKGAFFFAMAVAVGLTRDAAMIVSVCLARRACHEPQEGNRETSQRIQNFGGMDVLCTDKTGTLTEDRVVLQRTAMSPAEKRMKCSGWLLISHFRLA